MGYNQLGDYYIMDTYRNVATTYGISDLEKLAKEIGVRVDGQVVYS